jgi:hypothetical protein
MKKKTKELLSSFEVYDCPNIGNDERHPKTTLKVEIPFIDTKIEYFYLCPYCRCCFSRHSIEKNEKI